MVLKPGECIFYDYFAYIFENSGDILKTRFQDDMIIDNEFVSKEFYTYRPQQLLCSVKTLYKTQSNF